MKRICDPFAYSDGPIENTFWAETVPVSARSALSENITTQVAVIGAGYTGLNTALKLAEAGVDVTVLDAKQIGWGASGRNGGFCCLGGAKASSESLKRRFGSGSLSEYLSAERAAVDHVDSLLSRFDWDVDRHSDGETMLAHNARTAAGFAQEAEDLATLYKKPIDVIAKEDLADHGLGGGFYGAITTPIGFALNPQKYVSNLAQSAENAGAIIHCDTPVTETRQRGSQWHLTTPQGQVTAKKLVIATNGYSSESTPPWLSGRFLPAQSSVIVTRPITSAEQAAQGWTSRQMSYDSRNLLHYFRLMPDNRFLFGMRGGLSTSQRTSEKIKIRIRQHFEQLFPAWAHIETRYHWSGFVCYSRGQTPFAGRVPGVENLYAGFAYHGNGVAMGSYAGALIAQDILQGSTLTHPDIMQMTPGRFPFGRYRRLAMYPGYLYYGLKDL
ncbi:NAD(P)/FAD-dependent oxidoreductase [Shimia sagamensis]|uniref:Glycine/D-amino acid oxidase n=1 Tax=Shimia sagamensis TaxID=1566352 RepID=A0ABY1NE26_9RHOB|nr:FAD-binding oxidoreductase [Shimia sagamensis]SMP07446.1 Glycine/D-amino acid oxidase [Shimia sagamensis]